MFFKRGKKKTADIKGQQDDVKIINPKHRKHAFCGMQTNKSTASVTAVRSDLFLDLKKIAKPLTLENKSFASITAVAVTYFLLLIK